jgi:hypothetical protein
VLAELSVQHSRLFHLVDLVKYRIDQLVTDPHWSCKTIQSHVIHSEKLVQEAPLSNALSYCHIDGSKSIATTKSDLEYCLNNLSTNGIICQDDFGNNKWPTIVDVVKDLEFEKKLKIILVGDSSVWITRPEYYDYWMTLLATDKEFKLLSNLLHCVSSGPMGRTPSYYFLNSVCAAEISCTDPEELDYYNALLQYTHGYLIMPYLNQSTPGVKLGLQKIYKLTLAWSGLRGDHWPDRPPVTKEDIDNLPDYIITELSELFQFNNLYETL